MKRKAARDGHAIAAELTTALNTISENATDRSAAVTQRLTALEQEAAVLRDVQDRLAKIT